MANTVNINKQIQWDGTKGSVHYVVSSDGTDLTNESLVDISTLAPAPASIKLRSIDIIHYGNFISFFEFDATTDQEIDRFETQAADVSQQFVRDYTDMVDAGIRPDDKTAAAFTGDLLMTTSGAANGDGWNVLIVFMKGG